MSSPSHTALTQHPSDEVPDEYKCPITLQPMVDPVIATDGHSYERTEIERWLQNHYTSPKTGAQLTSTALFPNQALKGLIADWCEKQQQPQQQEDTTMIDSSALATSSANSFSVTLSIAVDEPHDGQQRVTVQTVPKRYEVGQSPVEAIYVVDNSGSMSLIPEAPQAGEKAVLSRLDLSGHCVNVQIHASTKQDRIGIVTFSSDAQVVVPLQQMTPAAKISTIAGIKRVRPQTSTNTWRALHVAFEQANAEPTDQPVNIVLLTDGVTNCGVPRKGWDEYIAEKRRDSRNDVRVHTISFDNDINVADLTTIARAGDGTYGHIPDGSQLNVIQAMGAMFRTELTQGTPQLNIDKDVYPKGKMPLAPFREGSPNTVSFWVPQKPDGTSYTAAELATKMQLVYTPLSSSKEDVQDTAFVPLDGADALDVSVVSHAREAMLALLTTCISESVSLEKKSAAVREAATKLRELVSRGSRMGDVLDKLLQDVNGQITLAVTPAFYAKWGRNHLWFEYFAHLRQVVNTTRAIGTQALYGGEAFDAQLDAAEELFMKLPPPTPSCPSTPPQQQYRGGGGGSSTVYRGCHVAAAAPPPAPVDMSSYQGGGCFHPACHTVTANGNPLRIADVRAGDELRAFDAHGKLCTVTVETVVTFAALCGQPMALTTLPSGWRGTPWHPIYHNDKWVFPHTVEGATTEMSYTADRVISVVFARDPVTGQRPTSLLVEGCRSVALAHGLTADAVASHAFYGTEAVVHALQPFAGYEQGHVTIRMGGVERDRCTGLVCGFNVAYEVDDVILTERRETNARAAAAMLSSRVGLTAAL